MCGIAGYFGRRLRLEPDKILEKMLAAIKYRGPDGQGTALFDQAGLGHVRLAIIDIAGGAQPMATPDLRFHISYNGELYNFKELRKELKGLGHQFKTSSDTEVVLKAFQTYGMEAFERFRGMFALALWDDLKKQGILVRDRFGIKPLFWTRAKDGIYFGSEIKAILPALSMGPDLDLESLNLLMNFRYIPGDQTMFKGISHLPPGHCLIWQHETINIKRWARPFEIGVSSAEIDLEQVRLLLKQSVKRQLVSDVPVGGYLSGGIDSATLASLASGNIGNQSREYPTFTIQTGDSPQEWENAARTAELFTLPNYQERIKVNLEEMLPRLIYHLEVPKVNSVQSALVALLARKHVKVALSGLGGDELFLGYNLHAFLARLVSFSAKVPRPLTKSCGKLIQAVARPMSLRFEEMGRFGSLLGQLPDFCRAYGIFRNLWDTPEERRRIYGPRLLEAQTGSAFDFLQSQWPVCADPLAAVTQFEIEQKMVNDLLLQEDRVSMAQGLEVRVPFLDEELATMILKIRAMDKIPGYKLKNILKSAAGQWLPQEVINRSKSGFQVPIHDFFNTHLRPLADHYLSRKRLLDDGLFNHNFVENVLAARPHFRLRWHYFLLYLMIGVNIWSDIFIKGEIDKT